MKSQAFSRGLPACGLSFAASRQPQGSQSLYLTVEASVEGPAGKAERNVFTFSNLVWKDTHVSPRFSWDGEDAYILPLA